MNSHHSRSCFFLLAAYMPYNTHVILFDVHFSPCLFHSSIRISSWFFINIKSIIWFFWLKRLVYAVVFTVVVVFFSIGLSRLGFIFLQWNIWNNRNRINISPTIDMDAYTDVVLVAVVTGTKLLLFLLLWTRAICAYMFLLLLWIFFLNLSVPQ